MSVLKKHGVVMLPTEKASEFGIHMNGSLCFHPKAKWNLNITPHHLYILSEEEIKEGDWYYTPIKRSIEQCVNKLLIIKGGSNDVVQLKIIATTDTSLRIGGNTGRRENGISIPIPQPSESFIQKYVEKYNKGEQITEVMVEYYIKGRFEDPMVCLRGCSVYDGTCRHLLNKEEVLKISQDNTITIRQVKDAWTREEVEDLCRRAYVQGADDNKDIGYKDAEEGLASEINEWLKENL